MRVSSQGRSAFSLRRREFLLPHDVRRDELLDFCAFHLKRLRKAREKRRRKQERKAERQRAR